MSHRGTADETSVTHPVARCNGPCRFRWRPGRSRGQTDAVLTLRGDRPLPAGWDPDVPPGRTALVATEDDETMAALVVREEQGVVNGSQVWFAPGAETPERAAALVDALVAQDPDATAVTLEVEPDHPTLLAALHDAPVLGHAMSKPVADPPPPLPPGYGYRPMTEDEYTAWHEDHVRSYAEDGIARTGGNRELAYERARADFARYLPDGLATADHSIVVLTQDGAPVGSLWLGHHRDGVTFGFDFEIDADKRGRGLGRAGMAVGEHLAARAGDRELGLHVFGDNTVARTLYLSCGFRVTGTNLDLLGRRRAAPA